MYIVAQLIGGIAGSALSFALNVSGTRGNIDGLRLAKGYGETRGFFMELLLTSVLVFAFLASTSNDNQRKNFGFANALAVGLAITLAHLVGIPYTGSAINPARAFGPSVVCNKWQSYHWIYWIAPLCGGVLAALVYRFAIKPELTVSSTRESPENAPLITAES